MSAPPPAPPAPARPCARGRRCHALDDVLSGSDGARGFCAELAARGYALVELPPRLHALVDDARAASADFFRLGALEKQSVGGFARIGAAYAGYRQDARTGGEFLELRIARTGALVPAPPAAVAHLDAPARELSRTLLALAHRLLAAMAEQLGLRPEVFTELLDAPDGEADAPDGVVHSVLRVCCYPAATPPSLPPSSDAAIADESARAGTFLASSAETARVLFDEHTDSSMVTLSLLDPASPGLQLRVHARDGTPLGACDGGWDAVEASVPHAHCLLVHVGDFVAALTKGHYPAARHRVVREPCDAHAPARVSLPFLARPRPERQLDTRAHEPGVREADAKLLALSQVTCSELRRLFDAFGRRQHVLALEQREQQRRDGARRQRAAAFRLEVLARRLGAPCEGPALSDSELSG